jgi:hypothetical protein
VVKAKTMDGKSEEEWKKEEKEKVWKSPALCARRRLKTEEACR